MNRPITNIRGHLLAWLGLLALVLGGSTVHAQDASGLRIDLNIPTLRLTVYDGEEVLRSYPVAVGQPGHDTPAGEFTISHAEWNPWWRPPAREWAKNEKVTPPGPRNPMGKVKLYFAPLYFIHGTPDHKSIGSAASHGCVRMLNRDVIELAKLLHQHASDGVGERTLNRVVKGGNTRRIGFDRRIALTVRYEPVVVEDGEVVVYPDIYKRASPHPERVYQALIGAGYDASHVRRERVSTLLERAKKGNERVSMKIGELLAAD